MINSKTDSFYFKQPSLNFIDELKTPLHSVKPEWFNSQKPGDGETSVMGAYLKFEYPDNENLLETAICDFKLFLDVYEISGDAYPIIVTKGDSKCFEAYTVDVTEDRCKIVANDTEGVRRALVFVEDEIRRIQGAVLPLGKIERYPSVKTRITRGSFSPTNRPPKNIDELENDEDYYPDEYLNRLAHDGANGIWIYTYFKELLTFEDFPEYGINSKRRIEKLQKVVAKCKRFGIKVYVFAIEPQYLTPEMAKKYPKALGYTRSDGNSSFCSYSEIGKKYCVETVKTLFELVPDLGGFINITDGERLTVCSNFHVNHCPVCKNKSRGEILAHTVDLFTEGMKKANSKGEFISWTYGHRYWKYDHIEEYVQKVSPDAMLMQNLEDAAIDYQLGKPRQAFDYWLSYPGPSQMFNFTAEAAQKYKKTMYAKMQVCTSHEIGSVPYIPVPGILFDKYRACYEFDVKGVLQCWYSGNYSCLMSKMAGELAFENDYSDKNATLTRLAEIFYGRKNAPDVVKAWECFEEGYKNYPLNIMFSYYGPMHDSVAWHLSLIPKNKELPRSWLVVDRLDGDRMSDCLFYGHTLDEAIILTSKMSDLWKEGLSYLKGDDKEWSVERAIGLLFESGNNILKFYRLREELAHGTDDKLKILCRMESIVNEEIENSKAMIKLCKIDNSLGYHGEAEGYKFFPEKIEARIAQLETLKETEFPCVRKRIEQSLHPLEYYLGDIQNGWEMIKGDISSAKFIKHPKLDASFRISYDDENIYLELKGDSIGSFGICFEYTPLWPSPAIVVKDGKIDFEFFVCNHQSMFGDKIEKEFSKYNLCGNVLTISREKCGWTADTALKLRIAADTSPWIEEPDGAHTLGKDYIVPKEFGWLIPKMPADGARVALTTDTKGGFKI